MPTPSHLKKHFKAQHVFTDREKPQKVFADGVSEPQLKDDYRILNYYGFGGLGKTALCEQFTLTLENKKIERKQKKSLGWAKLDFELSHYRNPEEALLSIRLQLAEQCNISFPAFDTAFARYFSFARKGYNIKDVHPALFNQANDMLQDIESVAGGLINEIPGVGLIYKYLKKLKTKTQEWWERRGKEVLNDLDSLEQHKLLKRLPMYLGADLCDWLIDEKESNKRRLVILMDTYEALWRNQPTKTGSESLRVDVWIRELVENTPGILFVILGRDKLNWGEKWEPYIDSHLLDTLSYHDADKYLQQVPISESDIRDVIVENSAGIPFYLDLQIDQYEELKHKKIELKASQFGGKEEEILARFIDHLDEQIRLALKVASHANFIDEGLAIILAGKFLGGGANIPFKKLTNYSFWRQKNNIWSMHTLLREYLQDQQIKEEPESYKQTHEFLFEYYDTQLGNIQNVIDITEKHKLALQEAGYHLKQIDLKKFPKWASKRGQVFHLAFAWDFLKPLWQSALEIAQQQLGNEHQGVATSLNNLAELYRSQGEYAKAEPLFLRSLEIEKKHLVENGSVATTLNNLGLMYVSQGKYTKGEPLLHRSLRIREKYLGVEPADFISSLNNLGMMYASQGKYTKAELLLLRSLKTSEESLDPQHPYVTGAQDSLATLFILQGKYTLAEPLLLSCLKLREEYLGEDHPDAINTLIRLALVYTSQGEHAKAEPLCLMGIKILEKNYPNGHPKIETIKKIYSKTGGQNISFAFY